MKLVSAAAQDITVWRRTATLHLTRFILLNRCDDYSNMFSDPSLYLSMDLVKRSFSF